MSYCKAPLAGLGVVPTITYFTKFRVCPRSGRDPYLAAYKQTDPVTGEQLGRAPHGYKRFSQIFATKLAAEPHATFERRLELEREAGQEARRSPAYTDLTVAHNKSVSVLHASFREQGRRARLAGDTTAEAVW